MPLRARGIQQSKVPAELAEQMTAPVAADMKRQKDDALAKLVAAADAAFGLQPLGESGGLTEAERLRVLMSYLLWMHRASEEARPFWTSQSRASPSTPAGSPTGSGAGSGTGEKK